MTEYNYNHPKNREGTHLKEEIQDYQKELSARDFIRGIGGSNGNLLGTVFLVVACLIAGASLTALLTLIRQNVTPASNYSVPAPSVPVAPSMPSIAPYP